MLYTSDARKLLAFVLGYFGTQQTQKIAGELDRWNEDQYLRFGKLLGQSRGILDIDPVGGPHEKS
jgi:hypothetical protein